MLGILGVEVLHWIPRNVPHPSLPPGTYRVNEASDPKLYNIPIFEPREKQEMRGQREREVG